MVNNPIFSFFWKFLFYYYFYDKFQTIVLNFILCAIFKVSLINSVQFIIVVASINFKLLYFILKNIYKDKSTFFKINLSYSK
jgi:hypothetical protein